MLGHAIDKECRHLNAHDGDPLRDRLLGRLAREHLPMIRYTLYESVGHNEPSSSGRLHLTDRELLANCLAGRALPV